MENELQSPQKVIELFLPKLWPSGCSCAHLVWVRV